jgi:hypothetical protein
MIRIRIILAAIVLCCLGLSRASAQENNSAFQRISIDFGGGFPIYYGDFYPLNATLDPMLQAPRQYNQSHIAAGINIPLAKFLDIRLEASQTTVYYSDETTPVNFKNTALDFSGQLKWNIINRRFGTYLLTGAGVNFHHRPKDILGNTDVTDADYSESVRRLSVTGGLGLQFWFSDRIGIFAEGIAQIPGSDFIDGFTRPPSGNRNADEKGYFKRDKFLTARGGIRFRLFKPTTPVAERSVDEPVSSFVPDPNATDEDLKEGKKPKENKEIPDIYKELGIQQSLSGYTMMVQHVMTIEELKRQKETAEQMLDRIFPNRALEVLLLEESEGFSIHFGYFKNRQDARSYRDEVLKYYGGALIRYYM